MTEDAWRIEGGIPLNGVVRPSGSKNASLPLLAATLLVDGETREAVIEGFTIQNGNAVQSNGGGIDIGLSTSPTIRNCVFRDNRASALGGGRRR